MKMHFIRLLMICFLCCLSMESDAQEFELGGIVKDSLSDEPIKGVLVMVDQKTEYSALTNKAGKFTIVGLKDEVKIISLLKDGYAVLNREISRESAGIQLEFKLLLRNVSLDEVRITESKNIEEMTPMPAVSEVGIFKGMKSEVIRLKNITANLSANNSRQVYNRIAGLNIWENDGAGIQLGIGARGLSPNRTSNFNVRQNQYDISADALGYPESYYTPPLQGVEKIQLIRGAAAMQYGTQFGGLLNFKMKKPPPNGETEIVVDQSVSTFGLGDSIASPLATTTSFVSLGTSGKKTGFYAFYQYKQGQGWRLRSDYNVHTAYGILQHEFSDKWKAAVEYTHMSYLAEQAGGLTDEEFENDPRLTKRFRNWFKVNWNIASATLRYVPNSKLEFSSKFFALSASRDALGFLGQTQRIDPLAERDLIASVFENYGLETRMIHKKEWDTGFLISAVGFRLYQGQSQTQQGISTDGDLANFEFNEDLVGEFSDYEFPNINAAAFAQLLIPVSKKISLTPGIRYEYIDTQSDGTFRNIIQDAAGNVLEDTLLFDNRNRERDFVLFGLGASYKEAGTEWYANAGQNYRAINFTDIQVRNTSLVIDPDIQDETGYNFDLGVRGKAKNNFTYDVSAFALLYNNRIGEFFTTDDLNRPIRLRSNIASARTTGLEVFLQNDLSEYFVDEKADFRMTVFINGSLIRAKYINSDVPAFRDKDVELVPEWTLRTGLNVTRKKWDMALQFSLVDEQFSDATNVGSNPEFPSTPNAVHGLIPAYHVVDLSIGYQVTKWKISASINNLTNNFYFTRRASGYPGPGIIPSDGRSIHLGVKYTWSIPRN